MDRLIRYRALAAAAGRQPEQRVEIVTGSVQLTRVTGPADFAWRRIRDEVFQRRPPHALTLDAELVDDQAVRVLRLFEKVGTPIPSVIHAQSVAGHRLPHVLDAASLQHVDVLVSGEQAALECALSKADPPLHVQLVEFLAPRTQFGIELLERFGRDETAQRLSAETLANRIGVCRSTLYAKVRAARLPPIYHIQFLFRAEPGIRCLLAGGTQEDAAFRTTFHDVACFRRSVRRYIGVTLEDLVALRTWEAVGERWLAHARFRANRRARAALPTGRAALVPAGS